MGYRHYFTVNEGLSPDKWADLLEDVREIILTSKVVVADWEGVGVPEITADVIRFNGIGQDSHETFHISRQPGGFNFCKTAQKPYDEVVTAVLLRAKDYFGDGLTLASDGTWEEWLPGRDLYWSIFDRHPWKPFGDPEPLTQEDKDLLTDVVARGLADMEFDGQIDEADRARALYQHLIQSV